MDDTILLYQAKESEAKIFKQVLTMYERASHQKVNMKKSKLYVLNALAREKKEISQDSCMQVG